MADASKVARGLLATKEKRLSLSIPPETHKKVKRMAVDNNTTIKDLFIEATEQYLVKKYPEI